jgi:CheY-specific phosphatase CheX
MTSVEVVNTFVDQALAVVRACLGVDGHLQHLGLTRRVDPPPMISVVVEIQGAIVGGVTWVFSEELARTAAGWFLHTQSLDGIDLSTCAYASAELANIIAGHAAGLLAEDGYPVELLPPRHISGGDELRERTVEVALDTDRGRMKLLFGVTGVDV